MSGEDKGTPEAKTFEPGKYLVNLNGRGEYLEVKWRLLWLRTEHPDALIETELVKLEDHAAVFKARITLPDGGGATGYGSETAGDFRDFLEKAETKAIGRACAALGYGTQFCQDHEFGAGAAVGTMRIVDAPIDYSKTRGAQQRQQSTGQRQAPTGAAQTAQKTVADQGNERATERQVKFIHAIAREAGLDEQELADWVHELYNDQSVDQLNRRDASTLIEALQRRRNEIA